MNVSRRRTPAMMSLLGLAAALVAACGGGAGGATVYGGPAPQPSVPSQSQVVHVNFFGSGSGSIFDALFGTVKGYTQASHSQVLGLSPGTQVVITNNDTVPHTLNVYSGGYPNPSSVTTAAAGGNVLQAGYQSGILGAGASTPVLTVGAAGTYYIACALHYQTQLPFMQDGLIVQVGATPGPQATIASGGPPCTGYGCS